MNEMENLSKQIKNNRILLIVMLTMVSIIFALIGFLFVKGMKIAKEAEPVVAEIKKIDFAKVSSEINEIDFDQLQKIVKRFDEISQIDVEALIEPIEDIEFEKIAELVESIDVKEVQKAMENLGEASENLEIVMDKIAPIMKLFGK